MDDTTGTVQLLVADKGNRTAIRKMLSEYFDVETSQTVQDADLYLIEDHLFSEHHEALREQVEQAHPAFCPVVLIRRKTTELAHPARDAAFNEGPILIDDVVDAPIDRSLLIRRLHSLLVRRRQSEELSNHITALEEREQELRRFERAVEDSGTATVITDTDGIIEYANSEFKALTGYIETDILRQPLETFLAEESLGTLNESFWQTMAEEKEWEGELLLERKNDQRRIIDTTITPIRDDAGDNEGFVVVMPDITQRIEREQLLQDREEELDLLRQILSRYLRHNLRNDLNVILGFAEVLEEKLPDQDAQDAARIIDTTKRLIDTSEKARTYSTLIEQESDLASYNVSAIVEGIVSDTRERYPDVSIEVGTPDECHVLARGGIREAIESLIDNAARYNDADSPWVHITVTDLDGTRVVIEDNGPGISELELSTLEQGSETPLRHSQGIGLWLSKWVIEGVDGRLSFDTTDVGGTRVTIDFPQAEQVGAQGIAVSDLKAREQRLRTITQRMTDAVVEVDASWHITFVDDHAEKILGVDADAIQGRHFWDVFSDARETRFEKVYRDVMRSRSAASIEEYYEGIDRWLKIYVYPDFDGGISFYFRDITERKQRERDLHELEQFNRELVENAPVGLFRLDNEMRVIYENDRAEEIMGVPEDEDESVAIGKDPRSLSSVGKDAERDVFDRLEVGETVSFEFPFESLYGKKRYVTGQGVPLFDNGTFDGAILMVQDITEKRERERLFEAIFNNTYTLTGVMDPDGTLQEANETALSFGGIDREAVVGKPIWESYWFQESPNARQTARKAVTKAQNGELFRDEVQVQGEDDVMVIDFTVRPVYDEEGSVTLLIPEGRDITELKEQEQQLEAERRRFQSLIEVLPHGVYRADPDTLETIYTNDAFKQIHGYTASERIDNPDLWNQSLHPDDAPTVTEAFQNHRESREPGQLEYRIQTTDGDTRWIEDTFRWEYDDAGNVTALVGVYTDITERKEREREQEKLIREIQESEEKLNLALEAGEMGMWVLDLQSEKSPVRTPQHDRIFGYENPVENWSFERFLEHVHPADREQIQESFDEAFESGELEFECRIFRSDGELRWIAADGKFYVDSGGTPDHAIGVVEDITEQKNREHNLEKRVKELTAIKETAQTFVRRDASLDESFEEFIERLPQSFQYPVITAAKITYKDHEASTDEFKPREECLTAQITTVTDGKVRIDVVYLEERPPEDNGPFLSEEQGLLDILVALIGSYAERWEHMQRLEQQNEALATKTRQLEAILQNTTTPMFMKDDTGEYIFANQEYYDLFDLQDQDIVGRTDHDIHPPEMAAEVQKNDQTVIDRGEPVEIEERIFVDDEERIYLSTKVPIYDTGDRSDPDEPVAVFGVAVDITDRKEAEQQLREEQQFVQSIFQSLPDLLYAFDTDGNPIRWNEETEAVTGYSSAEIEDMHITEFVPDDEVETVGTQFQMILDEGRSVTVKSAVKTKNDTRVLYEFTGGPLEAADGTIRGVTGIGRDITERTAHEQQLEALNRTAQELMSAETKDEVVTIGVETTRDLLGIDLNAIHLYDEDAEGLVPVAATDAVYDLIGEPPTFTSDDSIAWRVYQRGETLTVDDVHGDPDRYNPDTPIRSELYLPLGDYGILLAGSPSPETFDEQDVLMGEILAGGLTTALEQVERTEQLRTRERELTKQNDRLEEFASVVSHDLRNPLTVASGRLELAASECDSEHLEHIEQAHERMGTLIENLLTLAREGAAVTDTEPVALAPLIEGCWANVETDEATLVTDIDRTVQADTNRLKQLFENLMRNSVEHGSTSSRPQADDAVEHGGEDVTVKVGALNDGFYIEDDGLGIPVDEREDIFETGYSTSEDSTGFGLSIVKQIVDAHDWEIRVIEGADGGARFEITGVELSAE